MNILFVHNNFPAQYRHLVHALLREKNTNLAAIASPTARAIEGVKLLKYAFSTPDLSATHPFARRFDAECHRAEEVMYNLSSLTSSGFTPDIIMAHPGWGETLPLRAFFPDARFLLYCEYFYGSPERDLNFDPEFPASRLDGHVRLHLKNATTVMALADCDQGISPTRFQRSTYPAAFQSKISVIHEGVDVDAVKPDTKAKFQLPGGATLTRKDEVVTFVARNLEPLRGYHIFMRALERILKGRPRAQVVIVGADGTSYGAEPPAGTTWKSIYWQEVADRLDANRVHFVGRLPHADYVKALQVSSAHVYLTYPFVLSWSLLEAMSAGCAIVASDTPPVAEVCNADNAVLVPFFDVAGLADRVVEVLANPRRYAGIRHNARETILQGYDAERICVPKMMALIRGDEAPQSNKFGKAPTATQPEASPGRSGATSARSKGPRRAAR